MESPVGYVCAGHAESDAAERPGTALPLACLSQNVVWVESRSYVAL